MNSPLSCPQTERPRDARTLAARATATFGRLALAVGLASALLACASAEEEEKRRAVRSLQAAIRSAHDGDLDGAERLAREAREIAPGFVDPLFALASIEEARGNLEAARGHYRQVLVEDPSQVRAGIALATTFAAEGRFDEAADWFGRAIEADPGAATAYFNLASVAETREDPERAAALLRLAAVLDQDDPVAPLRIAGIRLAQGRLEDARVAADAALARAPQFPAAQAMRAEIDRRAAAAPR